jgi:hypothetical protein
MAKCVVEIDGVAVSTKTTRDQGDVKVCFG